MILFKKRPRLSAIEQPEDGALVCLRSGQTAHIRDIRSSDADLIYQHIASMSPESRNLFCPYEFDYSHARAIANDSHVPGNIRVLALVEEKPAGYAYISRRNASRDFVNLGIGVTDEFQGLGLGKALMQHLLERAKRLGFQGIELTVFKNNFKAQSLYLSLGFLFTGDADDGRQYAMRLTF